MQEVILYGAMAVFAFIAAIIMLIIGLSRKKKKVILPSILLFVASVFLGVSTVVIAAQKSLHKISEAFEPPTNEEVYDSVFGLSENTCLQVLDSEYPQFPGIDYAIWLHFSTCPEEVSRILSQYDFKLKTTLYNKTPHSWSAEEHLPWWEPEMMSNKVLVYDYYNTDEQVSRTIWVSQDSTQAYCKEIVDL